MLTVKTLGSPHIFIGLSEESGEWFILPGQRSCVGHRIEIQSERFGSLSEWWH